MGRHRLLLTLVCFMVAAAVLGARPERETKMMANWTVEAGGVVGPLPVPRRDGGSSVEKALGERRSVREYRDAPLALTEVGQLLWAAQGVTSPRGLRTAPSAGALYPLEIYLVAGNVAGLPAGVYRYLPAGHRLELSASGDRRSALADAALRQPWVRKAPAVLVVAAVFARTTGKYGQRGIRYVHLDAGCAAENVYLQATALGLGTVFVGAFHDEEVREAIALPREEEPLAILPVGRR